MSGWGVCKLSLLNVKAKGPPTSHSRNEAALFSGLRLSPWQQLRQLHWRRNEAALFSGLRLYDVERRRPGCFGVEMKPRSLAIGDCYDWSYWAFLIIGRL